MGMLPVQVEAGFPDGGQYVHLTEVDPVPFKPDPKNSPISAVWAAKPRLTFAITDSIIERWLSCWFVISTMPWFRL